MYIYIYTHRRNGKEMETTIQGLGFRGVIYPAVENQHMEQGERTGNWAYIGAKKED